MFRFQHGGGPQDPVPTHKYALRNRAEVCPGYFNNFSMPLRSPYARRNSSGTSRQSVPSSPDVSVSTGRRVLLPTPVQPPAVPVTSSSVQGPSSVPALLDLLGRGQPPRTPIVPIPCKFHFCFRFVSFLSCFRLSFRFFSSVNTVEDVAGIRHTQRIHDNASEMALMLYNMSQNLRAQAAHLVILFRCSLCRDR